MDVRGLTGKEYQRGWIDQTDYVQVQNVIREYVLADFGCQLDIS